MTTLIKPTVRQLLGAGGITREVRDPQVIMSEQVMRALTERRHAVIEAGTGTGKSLGYLVPAVLSGKTTVVATGTIALQEQLMAKDLPDLAEALEPFGIEFSYAVAKGRGNYVSKRRLQIAYGKARQLSFHASDRDRAMVEELERLVELDRFGIGDKSVLGFEPSPAVWARVVSDRDNCKGKKCPNYNVCHYFKARNELPHTDIIVANHAVVAADLKTGGRMLPPYSQLVIDEGHHFRDAIVSAFTDTIRRGGAMRINRDVNDEIGDFLDHPPAKALVAAEDALLQPLVERMGKEGAIPVDPIHPSLIEGYAGALSRIYNHLPQEQHLNQLRERIRRIEEAALGLNSRKDKVVWAEQTPTGVALNQAPVDISEILQDNLYSGTTVVYTSATISSGERDFSYAKQILGLTNYPTIEGQYGSPFQYNRQCLLYLPTHLPEPRPSEPIDQATIDEMGALVQATRGRAFLLFTARSAMEKAFDALIDRFTALGYPAEKQGGQLNNKRLVEWFKETPGAVLFGLASFWEGVSVEGDALSLVVMDKIPFPSPADPVMMARENLIKAAGGDAFRQLFLPTAILRIKQGLGRLVRTQTDRGIVAILDPRITAKGYGRNILRALPAVKVTKRFPTSQELAIFIA